MKEENLLKILEYNKISLKESLQLISASLNLEFYIEEDLQIHTLSSEFFVLDIQNEKCALIFVNENLNIKLSYVAAYLNNFIGKWPEFYFILKYLNASNNFTAQDPKSQPKFSKYKCMCDCLTSGEYCQIYNLEEIPSMFNIFTHSDFDYPLDVLFNKANTDTIIIAPENFATIYCLKDFSRKVYNNFRSEKEFSYEDKEIKVVGKSVYISNIRSPIASLAFLRGCTLLDCLEYHKIFEKK